MMRVTQVCACLPRRSRVRYAVLNLHSSAASRPVRVVDAFIALGGNADKTGEISADKLRSIVKDFGLTIDIEVRLLRCSTVQLPSSFPWGPAKCGEQQMLSIGRRN